MTADVSGRGFAYDAENVLRSASGLASGVAVTDSAGAAVEKYRYSPYGVSGAEGNSGFPPHPEEPPKAASRRAG